MRPETPTALIICSFAVLAALISGIMLDMHLLDRTWFWAVVHNGGVLGAMIFAARHYFQSQPKIMHFAESEWIIKEAPSGMVISWSDVSITIPESIHGKGKNPNVSFVSGGEYVRPNIDFTYKVEKDGTIIIHPDENRFMERKSVTIKISA